MSNRTLPTPLVDTFDAGFVTYLRLVSWKCDQGYQTYRHQEVDIWSRPFALRENCKTPAIQLEITKKKPSAPGGFNLICYWWVQKKDGADPVIMYKGKSEAKADDKLLSGVYENLTDYRGIYDDVIKALYQHPQLIRATSPESQLSISSMHPRPPKRARDSVQDPDAIKRSCHTARRYVETLRSSRENKLWGSEDPYGDSVFSEGFRNSIMTNDGGKGASSATWASSRLLQYPFGGDQSAMEQ
jgi:hypothetical protein